MRVDRPAGLLPRGWSRFPTGIGRGTTGRFARIFGSERVCHRLGACAV